MEKFNQFYPNLSFTYGSSKGEIAFLDCKVNLFENKLTTDLYVKQTLRLHRICSFKTDFVKGNNEIKLWLLKRGYPERLIDSEMKKS